MLTASKAMDTLIRAFEARQHPAPDPTLLSKAAHEIRTPLTTLLAQAEDLEQRLLEQRDADPAAVHRIGSEARRLRRLVDELLDLSLIDSGTLRLELQTADLGELAREACLSTEIDPAIVEVTGPVVGRYDTLRISLCLEAVLDNAVKYGGPATPRVLVWSQGEFAFVAVQDRGKGMPAEDAPRVFDRFYRGANAADLAVQGLGLGLHVAREIVRAHGGGIALCSTPLDGTTVTIALLADAPTVAGGTPHAR